MARLILPSDRQAAVDEGVLDERIASQWCTNFEYAIAPLHPSPRQHAARARDRWIAAHQDRGLLWIGRPGIDNGMHHALLVADAHDAAALVEALTYVQDALLRERR